MGEEQADPGELPLLPGFREMALRRMNRQRRSLVAELAEQRQAAGLSQTEIAARMGTSQSAVARLEAGEADVRASTLERYAAAVGSEITWRLEDRTPGSLQRAERPGSPQRAARPGSLQRAEQPGSP
ncbi:MAG: helix-turn-helix domain-containing protein [Streptosporangiaceae bacterium]|jgi:transcriptional regulator with XRE-family HTH domain